MGSPKVIAVRQNWLKECFFSSFLFFLTAAGAPLQQTEKRKEKVVNLVNTLLPQNALHPPTRHHPHQIVFSTILRRLQKRTLGATFLSTGECGERSAHAQISQFCGESEYACHVRLCTHKEKRKNSVLAIVYTQAGARPCRLYAPGAKKRSSGFDRCCRMPCLLLQVCIQLDCSLRNALGRQGFGRRRSIYSPNSKTPISFRGVRCSR